MVSQKEKHRYAVLFFFAEVGHSNISDKLKTKSKGGGCAAVGIVRFWTGQRKLRRKMTQMAFKTVESALAARKNRMIQ